MRQDPRMHKPFERNGRTCAAGLTTNVKVRVARINAETQRRKLAQAQYVDVPRLVINSSIRRIPKQATA